MSDDYESRREARRKEERRYHADVAYDVWRSGGNMDRVNYERVQDAFYNLVDSESAARAELRNQRPPEPQMTEEEYHEQRQED